MEPCLGRQTLVMLRSDCGVNLDWGRVVRSRGSMPGGMRLLVCHPLVPRMGDPRARRWRRVLAASAPPKRQRPDGGSADLADLTAWRGVAGDPSPGGAGRPGMSSVPVLPATSMVLDPPEVTPELLKRLTQLDSGDVYTLGVAGDRRALAAALRTDLGAGLSTDQVRGRGRGRGSDMEG